MARICIVTGAHLCRNPRVVKEAGALSEAGHTVTVLGPAFDDELVRTDAALTADARWAHRTVVDLRPAVGWRSTALRAQRRLAIEVKRFTGRDSAAMLGYGLRRMRRAAQAEKADLTIGHQEVGTWVCAQLARHGHRIGVDVEDWYSHHPHPSVRDRHAARLLQTVEGETLRQAAYATTTSGALADALASSYGAPRPDIVYNAFPWADRDTIDGCQLDRTDRSRLSLHWVSQTIGPDRGLDLVFDALRRVEIPVDLHLRGQLPDAHLGWLHSAFPSEPHRLHVHPLVPPSELLSRISEHDVGLALETTEIESRDLTVTNKILHYLLGGLAVIASRTAGQEEVAAYAPGAVSLVPQDDTEGFANAITALAEAPGRLAEARHTALDAARRRFCWERQAPILVEAVETALARGSHHRL